MAKPEHLKILKQGVNAWNKWREENPQVRPDLCEADLSSANLSGADLSHTDLYYADLSYAKLVGADLCDAILSRAHVGYASLSSANLTEAWLLYTNLTGASLENADFTNVSLGGSSLGGNDLSRVKGLELVKHHGPSSIGVDTIYKSRGDIPEVFLRGCGVPEDFITYMRSLVVQPIEFYTCFISFTEADDEFAERLYTDLQAKGVRCWRWKEDAKWGRSLMRSIDEAVRVYDKLIVVCSEASLNSPAVNREVERALQKEDEKARQGQEGEVLFPIRLDDYIFEGWSHHRQADVLAKNVGDFRHWKDHDTYQKKLSRLLRDLKAGEK
jgi:hypothetical protein